MRERQARVQMCAYTGEMRVLEAFAAAFINTFGITQPTEAQRRRAAWFILGMLLVTIALVAAVGYAFYRALHR